MPRILLVVTCIIQITVWNPPPDIRWNGSIIEWPISWMVCCGSIAGFAAALVTYLFTWISFLAIALSKQTFSILADVALLCAFPVSVYVFMAWHYFGGSGR